MTLFTSRAVTLVGLDGALIDVEADIANGLPVFTLVGLPDASLSESRDRVRAAVVNSGHSWPMQRLTVNLSPATLPKHGSMFDLAIAAAVLGCCGVLPSDALRSMVLLGELGLDGRVRPVRGILPAVAAAAKAGVPRVVVPAANVGEAKLVPGVDVLGVGSLRQLVATLTGAPEEGLDAAGFIVGAEAEQGASGALRLEDTWSDDLDDAGGGGAGPPKRDLADVHGQASARWALEIAAAGGHHLLLVGPPGSGKTMLAERLSGLLPDLSTADALDVTALHSLAGTLQRGVPLVRRPPYLEPHHTATVAALVGGGSGVPRPGVASLAHRGVLFLDEAPEFRSAALQALREPLESGRITIARSGASVTYPARFLLALAANPCPCGQASGRGSSCVCPSTRRRSYFGKLSGPLLDRVDLRIPVAAPGVVSLLTDIQPESTATVAARVSESRARAAARFGDLPWSCNGDVPAREFRRRWPLDSAAMSHLDSRLLRGEVSMRGADRVLRVAWTLADLGGRNRPGLSDIHGALALRTSEVAAA